MAKRMVIKLAAHAFRARMVGLAILFWAFPFRADAESFPTAVHAYLQQRVEAQGGNVGVVVGMVDEHGSNIVGYGKLDNGTDQRVSGDTVFEIGSVTKTFTGLLLEDMVERGEMKLDDPVARYLPDTVKVPSRNGKQITLLQLATHTSGLPRDPDNLDPKRAEYPCEGYTFEKLYEFLSDYQLTRDPGAEFEYSSAGIAVLARAISLKAGKGYETLVMERICRPLGMESTRITLTAQLESRFAVQHSLAGFTLPSSDFGPLASTGGFRATAGDMLKYVSANLGLTPSNLTPVMQRTHEIRFRNVMPESNIGLVWIISRDPQGTEIIWHNGAQYGCVAYVGFDKAQRRGVVILSNSRGFLDVNVLGKFLLTSEWRTDHRPMQGNIGSRVPGGYAGQYRRPPDLSPRLLAMRQFLRNVPRIGMYVAAGLCLALLAILLWRVGSLRKRAVILCCAVPAFGVMASAVALTSLRGDTSESGIGIRCEGGRLLARSIGPESWPVGVLLPPGEGKLLPDSEERFFESLGATPAVFSRDHRGKVTSLTLHHGGQPFCYEKVSDDPPPAPEPPYRPVIVKLDTKLLDACVGHYVFPSDDGSPAGGKLAIWREGDHLVGQVWAKNATRGAIDIYAESETRFVLKIDGSELNFVKNDKGEVMEVIHHCAGIPDHKGKKMELLGRGKPPTLSRRMPKADAVHRGSQRETGRVRPVNYTLG